MLDDLKYTPIAIGLRNLRHLYEQMVAGQVSDCERAARGLLGPAIAQIEAADAEMEGLKEHAREVRQQRTEHGLTSVVAQAFLSRIAEHVNGFLNGPYPGELGTRRILLAVADELQEASDALGGQP